MVEIIDRQLFALIAERRAAGVGDGERTDVLSLLLQARDESGELLTDQELRDELLSLVLAGHETTANSLAWIFERLLRTPAAYDRLRELVREGGPEADAYVEATINEGMRNRPVIPMIVRMVKRPWRFGEYVLPANTPVAVSIVALHHREDVYPRAVRVHARAVPRAQAGDEHVDPVRWRHPPLPGRDAGDGRAAGRPGGDRAPHRSGRRRTPSPSALDSAM